MRFTNFVTRSLPIATLFLAGSLMAKAPTPAVPAEASTTMVSYSPFIEGQVSETLKDIQSRAGQLSREADTLQSFTRGSAMSWQSHAIQLNAAKEHINAIGQQLEFLKTVKSASAAWQQQAIDRIMPIAVDIAARTSTAIESLNENRRHVSMAAYKDNLRALSGQADRLKQSIDPFVELNETQKRLEAIQDRLIEAES